MPANSPPRMVPDSTHTCRVPECLFPRILSQQIFMSASCTILGARETAEIKLNEVGTPHGPSTLWEGVPTAIRENTSDLCQMLKSAKESAEQGCEMLAPRPEGRVPQDRWCAGALLSPLLWPRAPREVCQPCVGCGVISLPSRQTDGGPSCGGRASVKAQMGAWSFASAEPLRCTGHVSSGSQDHGSARLAAPGWEWPLGGAALGAVVSGQPLPGHLPPPNTPDPIVETGLPGKDEMHMETLGPGSEPAQPLLSPRLLPAGQDAGLRSRVPLDGRYRGVGEERKHIGWSLQ